MHMASIVRSDAKKEIDKSVRLAVVAHELVKDDPIVLDSLGWALINAGQVNAGLEKCRQALEQIPDDETVQYHLGVGHALKGDIRKSKSYLLASLKGEMPSHAATRARDILREKDEDTEKTITVHKLILSAWGKPSVPSTSQIHLKAWSFPLT